MLFWLAVLSLFVSACASDSGSRRRNPRAGFSDRRGARIEIPINPEILQILQWEDARSTGGGELLALFEHRDDRIRRRATIAAGRLPFPEHGEELTARLCKLLEDPVLEVRTAAAFALGQRRDPKSGAVLMAYRNDPEARMRRSVVAAACRIPDARLHAELLLSLRDNAVAVRKAAAMGAALWDPETDDAAEVDRALLDALSPYTLAERSAARSDVAEEPEFVWRVLYARGRRRSDLGRGAFLEYSDAQDPLVRLFAIRGLSRIEPDNESLKALRNVIAPDKGDPDPDWRIVCEAAIGLGASSDRAALGALLRAVEHSSVHVRTTVLEALGNFQDEAQRVLPALRRGMLDVSPGVRATAIRSLVRVLDPDAGAEILRRHVTSEDAIVRAGVARAAGSVHDPRALEILLDLVRDGEPLVATAAATALGNHPGKRVRNVLHGLLGSEDNGLRLAAVLALRENPSPQDIGPLRRVYTSSQGDIGTEVAFNALENAARIGNDEAKQFLQWAVDSDQPHVRRTAVRLLREHFDVRAKLAKKPLDVEPVPLPGNEYPRWKTNPMVEIRTSRGDMRFELFPAEAPVHVYNFLELARRGYYDDLSFHRVVPNFVIQGGDYRGDGNGARPYAGEALRHEFTPRPYLRGALGMPRNEDPDSGGSQFFVTHRPTPHLDGRYTLFGELRAGDEVLDRIEMGDRILAIRVLP